MTSEELRKLIESNNPIPTIEEIGKINTALEKLRQVEKALISARQQAIETGVRVSRCVEALQAVLQASALDWAAGTDEEADLAWGEALHKVRQALADIENPVDVGKGTTST